MAESGNNASDGEMPDERAGRVAQVVEKWGRESSYTSTSVEGLSPADARRHQKAVSKRIPQRRTYKRRNSVWKSATPDTRTFALPDDQPLTNAEAQHILRRRGRHNSDTPASALRLTLSELLLVARLRERNLPRDSSGHVRIPEINVSHVTLLHLESMGAKVLCDYWLSRGRLREIAGNC